jgi:hypothetical protein
MDDSAHLHVVPPGLFTGGGKPPRLTSGEHQALARTAREIRLPYDRLRDDLLPSLLRAGLIYRVTEREVEITARHADPSKW